MRTITNREIARDPRRAVKVEKLVKRAVQLVAILESDKFVRGLRTNERRLALRSIKNLGRACGHLVLLNASL
jgi:hypothetical protein